MVHLRQTFEFLVLFRCLIFFKVLGIRVFLVFHTFHTSLVPSIFPKLLFRMHISFTCMSYIYSCTCFEQLGKALDQCMRLRRFKEAWDFCKFINNIETWQQLGKSAMRALDIEFGKFWQL